MTFDKVQAMRNAERHVSQGKIRTAIEEYKLAIELDSGLPLAHFKLGQAYLKLSRLDEAATYFRRELERNRRTSRPCFFCLPFCWPSKDLMKPSHCLTNCSR